MEKLTREEILEIMCAPAATDEPEETDFIDDGCEMDEEIFIRRQIAKELN
jgi:3-methyladenine DNA glycosylase AlkC